MISNRLLKVRRRRGRHDRGQSLAEFALVAPIFFLLLFSVIQLGLLFAAHNGLVDGVRSATRRAATYRVNEGSFDATVWSSICTTIGQALDDRLAGRQGQDLVVGYRPANLTKTIQYEWVANPEGDYFLVANITAVYKSPLYVPLVSIVIDNSDGSPGDGFLTLTASEQMRVENPPLNTPLALGPQPCP